MTRHVNIYRVVGRDYNGRIAVRIRVAAGSINDAQRIAQNWASDGAVTFNLLDIHRSADEPVIIDG